MFDNILELIDAHNFNEAQKEIKLLINCDDTRNQSIGYYLLGYVETHWANKNKDKRRAQRALLRNINSEFTLPDAYVRYAEIEDDKNVAINYLKSGIDRFPQNIKLYGSLLRITKDKALIIDEIENKNFVSYDLLKDVVEDLIKLGRWDRVERFIEKIQAHNDIDDAEEKRLNLLKAYSLIFRGVPKYNEAYELLLQVIKSDISNELAYSHYLGMIYTLLMQKRQEEAVEYFDRLPLEDKIHDFDDYPFYIFVDFMSVYKVIFDLLIRELQKDTRRKNKAKTLYALYLYHPSESFEIYRYRKADVNTIERYSKYGFNTVLNKALFNMRCHYGEYFEAYCVFLSFIRNNKNPENLDLDFENVVDNASDEVIDNIVDDLITCVAEDETISHSLLAKTILVHLFDHLHKKKKYTQVIALAELLSVETIKQTKRIFECAYAYAEKDHVRAEKLYLTIVKSEPQNSSALNNLGCIYEKKEQFDKAKYYFGLAYAQAPESELYSRNLGRIKKALRQQNEKTVDSIAERISLDALETIGYSENLTDKFNQLVDSDLKLILLRDLKECAIAVVSEQDKAATILCGSIIEALLMAKIQERKIVKYDISEISKSKHATSYPIMDMGLNELLFVSEKEKIICKNNYHLSHYIRDYRNVVHPAKEIRMTQKITHENVLIMWTVLKQLTDELLK